MWFTYLYLSLIPIGAAITIVGLILYYWVDKYNLLRRASVPSNIAGELSLYSMELLDLTLIFKPVGEGLLKRGQYWHKLKWEQGAVIENDMVKLCWTLNIG